MNIKELKINPEFEAVIPPLSAEEIRQLEDNILQDREVFTPIFTWDGFIVDGHHRYRILQKHPEIPYRIIPKDFENQYAAIAWICNHQLGRRNLTDRNRDYLVGQRYEFEVLSHGGDRRSEKVVSTDRSGLLKSGVNVTRQNIAKETGTSEGYVERSRGFARGVDAAEEILPGIKNEILSEVIKPTKEEVAAIAKAGEADRRQMAEALRTSEEERKKEAQRKREERTAHRAMMANIDRLATEHGNMDRPPVSIESHLQSFTLTAERFLGTCDSYFADVPELLTNETHRAGVMVTGEKFIQYFTKIKENRYEPYIV